MDDLISRKAAIKTILDLCPETTIQGSYDEYAVSCLCGASELLKQLPAVDAIPVEWLRDLQHRAMVGGYTELEGNIIMLLREWRQEGKKQNG